MSKEFYERLQRRISVAPEHGDQWKRDYQELDQGREKTRLRHDQVVKHIGSVKVLMDLGCGTGLLLDSLATVGMLPSWYLGVDFLDRPDLFKRVDKYGIRGTFVKKDIMDFLSVPMKTLNEPACVAVGVVGMRPFQSLLSIGRLLGGMYKMGPKSGLVTVPMQNDKMLGHPDQAYFDPDDVEFLLAKQPRVGMQLDTSYSDREMCVHW